VKATHSLENLIFVASKIFGNGKSNPNRRRIEPQSIDEAERVINQMLGKG
jgi:hypothetical protein